MTDARLSGVALATAAIPALLLFVVLPGSLYLGNLDEFMTPAGPLLRLLLLPALALAALIAIGLQLAPEHARQRLLAVVAVLTLLVWSQAYLLVWDYGELDGNPIDWQRASWRGWADGAIWLVALGAAIVFWRRLAQPLGLAAGIVVGLQAAHLLGSAFVQRDELAVKRQRHAAAGDFDAMARFSTTRNVVHIVLDSFQADVFRAIIDGARGEAFQSTMRGFTFFEEHLGVFPVTYFALPAMVSGRVYRNHMPREAFYDEVFAGNTVLNAAEAAGFEVDLASDPMMLDMLLRGRYTHAYLTSSRPAAADAARLVDLALFRAAPHWLKRMIYRDERWFVQRLFGGSDFERTPYYRHNAFLRDITQRLTADRPRPVYKFFHLLTTHGPYVARPDCGYAGRPLQRLREPVTHQSRCSLAWVMGLLERLQAAGLYDDALIMLMGDHGGNVPPLRFQPRSDAGLSLNPALVGSATPLLAIKPPGAAGPFRISAARTSMIDTAATIAALLSLDAGLPGRSLLDAPDPTERRFYQHELRADDGDSEYMGTITELKVTGSAYDGAAWRIEGEHRAPH